MNTAVLALAALTGGQLVDGHVHRTPHGGVMAHCGPYLIEVVLHQAASATAPAVAELELWVTTEQGRPLPPAARAVRVQVDGLPDRTMLTARGDHLVGRIAVSQALQPVSVHLELAERGHIREARVRWTLLDDRARIDDGLRL